MCPLRSLSGKAEVQRVWTVGRPRNAPRRTKYARSPLPSMPRPGTLGSVPGEQSPHPVLTHSSEASPWHGGVAPLSRCSPSGEASGTNQPPGMAVTGT
jgi:hypothetical protein